MAGKAILFFINGGEKSCKTLVSVHLHSVGKLLRQVSGPERSLAGDLGVTAVRQKKGEERTQERERSFQEKGYYYNFKWCHSVINFWCAAKPFALICRFTNTS
jgi:hypothetical protein